MSRQITLGFGLIACLLAIGGCADRDPYLRTDVWKPTGANAANIAAMAANPQDLIHGRGVTQFDTRAPELAVEHVWTDQPKQLLGGSSASSSSGASSGGGASGSGGGGSGGGSGAGAGGGSTGGGGAPGS